MYNYIMFWWAKRLAELDEFAAVCIVLLLALLIGWLFHVWKYRPWRREAIMMRLDIIGALERNVSSGMTFGALAATVMKSGYDQVFEGRDSGKLEVAMFHRSIDRLERKCEILYNTRTCKYHRIRS